MVQIKPFEKLTLLDDFLFSVAAEDMEFCRRMLQVILGKKIVSIRRRQTQKEIKTLPELRGIRLDLLIEDDTGAIYNVEVQIRNIGNLPRRSRFYQGLIDIPLLIRGEEDFNNINDTYLIVISPFDLFGAGKYRYTFKNLCLEDPAIHLDDGATRIFLNTRGTNTADVSPELIAFLKYAESSSSELTGEDDESDLAYIKSYIRKLKSSREIGVTYMQSWEKERLLRDEGRGEGIIEGTAMSILTLLKDFGTIPADLEKIIVSESDMTLLSKWLKIAAKANCLDDFLLKYRN